MERINCSLLGYNTFGIEAKCDSLIEYTSEDELKSIISRLAVSDYERPVLHIGGGSNLLFLGDYSGVVLHSQIKGIDVVEETADNVVVRVGAGVVWDDFVAYSIKNGWYGLENLSLIPGEVGASAVQNIGAYGAEAKDFITEVECIDLKTAEKHVFKNEDCAYSYRQSIFKTKAVWGRYAVTYVSYRLNKTFVPHLEYGGLRKIVAQQTEAGELTAEALRDIIISVRQQKLPDPKVEGNAGSFFMNPVVARAKYDELAALYANMPHYDVDEEHVKIPAGWMIDQCGWKGKRLGCAGVHDKQALVLVNKGGAKGQDIVALCNTIIKDVKDKFGIEIHPEVNFI